MRFGTRRESAEQTRLDRILMLGTEQVQNRHIHCRRNAPQQQNRNIPLARFQLTEVSLRNICVAGKLFPADGSVLTDRANPLSQDGQEFTSPEESASGSDSGGAG
jgi:hypothetical protein